METTTIVRGYTVLMAEAIDIGRVEKSGFVHFGLTCADCRKVTHFPKCGASDRVLCGACANDEDMLNMSGGVL